MFFMIFTSVSLHSKFEKLQNYLRMSTYLRIGSYRGYKNNFGKGRLKMFEKQEGRAKKGEITWNGG